MRTISLAGRAAAIVGAMKTKKNVIRGVIALAVAGVGAGVVATSAMATTASATTPASRRSDGGYGFTSVRSGITDSAGITGYLGPCPPVGDITHHYKITVYALDVADLDLPSSTPAQVTTFTMSSHIIGYAQMTVNAKR